MEARHGFSLTLSCFAVGVSLVWWVWASEFIVVELFTDIRILLLLVVLDMFFRSIQISFTCYWVCVLHVLQSFIVFVFLISEIILWIF